MSFFFLLCCKQQWHTEKNILKVILKQHTAQRLAHIGHNWGTSTHTHTLARTVNAGQKIHHIILCSISISEGEKPTITHKSWRRTTHFLANDKTQWQKTSKDKKLFWKDLKNISNKPLMRTANICVIWEVLHPIIIVEVYIIIFPNFAIKISILYFFFSMKTSTN